MKLPEAVLVPVTAAGESTCVVVVAMTASTVSPPSVAPRWTSLVIAVPRAADGETWRTRVKTALPGAHAAVPHPKLALVPTGGGVQLQPAGAVIETKVVPAGMS